MEIINQFCIYVYTGAWSAPFNRDLVVKVVVV